MNRKFKKVISSVLAAVMTLGVVSVANVSSVFANEITKINMADVLTSYIASTTAAGNAYVENTYISTTGGGTELYNDGTYTIKTAYKNHKLRTYDADSNFFQDAPTTGTLSGKVLNTGIYMYNGTKSLITLSGVKTGDEIEIYYYGCNSAGAPGTAATIKATQGSDSLFSDLTTSTTTTTPDYKKFVSSSDSDITFTATSGRFGINAIVITRGNELPDSEVTITNGENGSVLVTKENGDTVSNNETVAGGSTLTITATPESGYKAKVYANNTAVTLTGNSGKYKTTTSTTEIVVNYIKIINRSDITDSVLWSKDDTSTDSNVLAYGADATSDFYFECLSDNVTLTSGSYINVSGGKENALYFKTGNFDDKKATLDLSYSTGGTGDNAARKLNIYKGSELVFENESSNRDTKLTKSLELDSDTEYYICSANSNMWLYSVAISVEEKDSLTNASFVENDGKYYAISVVTADEATNNNYLLQKYGSSELTRTSTVYEKIQIGTQTYTAADFGGTGFLYASELTEVPDDKTATDVKAKVEEITKAFE